MTLAASGRAWRGRWPYLAVAAAAAIYLAAVLPDLANYPVLEWAQMRVVQPAANLSERGVYGNDLLTGFFGAERRGFEFMPLYALQVALAFKLLGVGVWQARMVSALGGLLALLLTFRLGRQLHGARLGALAALALVLWRLALPMPSEVERIGIDVNGTGMPLVDMARLIRFDIWVPVWTLSACGVFVWALRRGARWGYVAAGVLAGLATLTHVYGAFVLAVFGLVVVWVDGREAWRRPALWLPAAGWLLAMLPWGVYVAGDLAAYAGQMSRHGSVSDLLRVGFYGDNVLREPWRYLAWLGGSFREPVLWPRVGIWLLVAGVVMGLAKLWRRARATRHAAEVLLLTAWPVLALLLAFIIHYKRYYYVMLIMPFLALQCAWAALAVWQAWRGLARAALAVTLALAAIEGATGLAHGWQAARATTRYAALTGQLREGIAPGARLLLAETYWLGLREFEARSLQLPFLLADDRFFSHPDTLTEVLVSLGPDYVIAEERLLDIYARDPSQVSDNAQDWRELDAFLETHCPVVAVDIVTPDYGQVKVYRCDTGSMAERP